MLIDFSSITKREACVVYKVAPGTRQQNNGSFVICSAKALVESFGNKFHPPIEFVKASVISGVPTMHEIVTRPFLVQYNLSPIT